MENGAELKIEGRVGQVWIKSNSKFVTIFRADDWEIESKICYRGSIVMSYAIQSAERQIWIREFDPMNLSPHLDRWNFEGDFRTVRLWRDVDTVIEFSALMSSFEDGNPRTATFTVDGQIIEYLIRR